MTNHATCNMTTLNSSKLWPYHSKFCKSYDVSLWHRSPFGALMIPHHHYALPFLGIVLCQFVAMVIIIVSLHFRSKLVYCITNVFYWKF